MAGSIMDEYNSFEDCCKDLGREPTYEEMEGTNFYITDGNDGSLESEIMND